MIDFELIDDLMMTMRDGRAQTLIDQSQPANAEEEWRLRMRRLRANDPLFGPEGFNLDFDSCLLGFLDLARDPDAYRPEVARAFSLAAHYCVERRLRERAEAIVAEAAAIVGDDHEEVLVARAGIADAFGEREQARALLERAVASEPAPIAHRYFAHLCYVVGDFDGAVEHARHLLGTRYRLGEPLMRAVVAASRGDRAAEAQALSEALEIAEGSDQTAGLLASRALARAGLDDIEGARDDFVEALAHAPERFRAQMAEYVRHRLDALDKNGPDAPHKRLEAFPSIVQKWNYCGPAVLELCLRYVGVGMDQDLIAEAVKEPDGTPMYAIVSFLRDHGIEARRIEATPASLKAAIDLGYPVIIQDDYGNTSHVSVAIGYDDRLGIIITADPATHAPTTRSLESREQFAQELRFAGVLVMGPRDALTDGDRAAADEAGLVERPHIAKLDEISRKDFLAEGEWGRVIGVEAAGIAAEALALEPDFPQALVARVSALMSGAHSGSASHSSQVLFAGRLRHPGLVALRQIASRWSAGDDRTVDALADIAAAVEAEPFDARSHAVLGRLLVQVGEPVLAFTHLSRAVALAPYLPEATVYLAGVLAREMGERCQVSDLSYPSAVRGAFLPEDGYGRWGAMDDDRLARLADHVTAIAMEMDPEDHRALFARSGYLIAMGEAAQAQGLLREIVAGDPNWAAPVYQLAHVAEALGQRDEVLAAVEIVVSHGWELPGLIPGLLGCLRRIGEWDEAEKLVRTWVDRTKNDAEALSHYFVLVQERSKSQKAAAEALVALARERALDSDLTHGVVSVLEKKQMLGQAVELLRELIAANPDDAQLCYQLARILRHTPGHRLEARQLLERALQAAPWADDLHLDLAWLLVDEDPRAALEHCEQLDSRIVVNIEPRIRALLALGEDREARELQKKMAQLAGSESDAHLICANDLRSRGHLGQIAALAPFDAPPWDRPDEVGSWVWSNSFGGYGHETLLMLQERQDQALKIPSVAWFVAHSGGRWMAAFTARARRVVAATQNSPDEAREMEAGARALLGQVEGLLEYCGDNARALAAVGDLTDDHDVKREAYARAWALAPADRRVVAACQAGAFGEGDTALAWELARKLAEEYPFEHQGSERLAEMEAIDGDADEALRLARVAVSEHGACEHAAGVLALALALAEEWDEAAQVAEQAERLNASRDKAAWGPLVLAAARRDAAGVAESIAAYRKASPKSLAVKAFPALKRAAKRP